MATEEQKERLREMGQSRGAMARGQRMDKVSLTDEQWDAAWAVWVEPGYPQGRFICGPSHPDYVAPKENVNAEHS